MSFDFGKYMSAINYTKEDVFDENDEYVPFLINRNFSYFPDTLFFSYEISAHSHMIPDCMHFFYWVNSIPKRKRYCKFNKKTFNKAIPAICWMYNISKKKAEEYIRCMDEAQIEYVLEQHSMI